MIGEEANRVADILDITPVMARRFMAYKERFAIIEHKVVELDPNKSIDLQIIEAIRMKGR